MAKRNGQVTKGVFIAWDEEAVDVERRDAGTMRDRTVVVARHIITKDALWTNAVTPETIAAAERYVKQNIDQYDNFRVIVYDGKGV